MHPSKGMPVALRVDSSNVSTKLCNTSMYWEHAMHQAHRDCSNVLHLILTTMVKWGVSLLATPQIKNRSTEVK